MIIVYTSTIKNKTLFNANQTLLKTNDSIKKNTKNEIYFTNNSSKLYNSSMILNSIQ